MRTSTWLGDAARARAPCKPRAGWQGASGLASFHNDVLMLIPSVSFVPFWVDGVDYCLVLGGEPLTNNIALVELIWSIKSAAFRFTAQE